MQNNFDKIMMFLMFVFFVLAVLSMVFGVFLDVFSDFDYTLKDWIIDIVFAGVGFYFYSVLRDKEIKGASSV